MGRPLVATGLSLDGEVLVVNPLDLPDSGMVTLDEARRALHPQACLERVMYLTPARREEEVLLAAYTMCPVELELVDSEGRVTGFDFLAIDGEDGL